MTDVTKARPVVASLALTPVGIQHPPLLLEPLVKMSKRVIKNSLFCELA